jgi:hypothetical protein
MGLKNHATLGDEWINESERPAVYINSRHLSEGDFITGEYLGIQASGKFKRESVRIRLTTPITYSEPAEGKAEALPEKTYEAGTVVAINKVGNLQKAIEKAGLMVGDERAFVYRGSTEMKSGEYAGTESFLWEVRSKRSSNGGGLPD